MVTLSSVSSSDSYGALIVTLHTCDFLFVGFVTVTVTVFPSAGTASAVIVAVFVSDVSEIDRHSGSETYQSYPGYDTSGLHVTSSTTLSPTFIAASVWEITRLSAVATTFTSHVASFSVPPTQYSARITTSWFVTFLAVTLPVLSTSTYSLSLVSH